MRYIILKYGEGSRKFGDFGSFTAVCNRLDELGELYYWVTIS